MKKDIKTIVKEKYTEVVQAQTSCCAPKCCEPGVESSFSESYDSVEGYNPDADLGLGCGIPTQFAEIKPGDTVLDLGSGAGNDVFVARQLTGETGRVIGVDMTEAMIEKAQRNKEKLGVKNVEFLLGEIEDLPLPEASIDVAISNCVMNLVPDKAKAYQEVYRVLRPGGHFSVSDIVLDGALSPALRQAAALYAGCVSGALARGEYLEAVRQAGFRDIRLAKEKLIELSDEMLLPYISRKELAEFRESGTRIYSITVVGLK